MDLSEHHTTSYHPAIPGSAQSSFAGVNRSGYGFGNVYVTDNAIVHLGDSMGSHGSSAVDELSRLRGIEERQRRIDIQSLKNGLYFDSMDDRRSQLESVAEASVEWIWQTTFGSWLQNDEPFFWLSGKPGSGKSTLIKYLSSSHKTRSLLDKDGGQWMTLDFYFDFTVGTAIANSKKGLLRSLLFQLINKRPSIGALITERHSHALNGNWLGLEAELVDTICNALTSESVRFCVFIDGLDEYIGKMRDLVLSLKDVQRRTKIKICLASRPEKSISRMLAAFPGLRVEDHNAMTIQNYIQIACEDLEPDEVSSTQSLWKQIERDANGVILWARFVTDELIERLVVGATSKELQDIVQTYPKEMEGVYARILGELTQEQKLHAAVAFFAIEHGLSRFASGHEFSTYEFFITWTIMVESLDQGIEFDKNFNVQQFKIRIEAMLGGLLEFTPNDTVRFVHTTLESYLRDTGVLRCVVEDVISPYYRNGLAGQVFISLISQANDELIMDFGELDFSSVGDDYTSRSEPDDIVACLQLHDATRHFSHRLDFLLTAIGQLGRVLGDSKVQAHSVWSVVTSQVFELHPLICDYDSCDCVEEFRRSTYYWRDRWCLRYLASQGLYAAFEHGLQEIKYNRPYASADALEITIDIVRKAQLELETANSSKNTVHSSKASFALGGHELIDSILDGEPLEIQHLAICQVIHFPTEPRFAARLRQIQQPTDFRSTVPRSWCPYPMANLLCIWAWCSDTCHDKHIQATRLRSLLEMGFDVNSPSFQEGTVMHALFKYQEPVPNPNHIQLHHITWPFSRVKFDLLREAGFDFTSNRAGTLLQSAQQFRIGLQQRCQWMKLRPQDNEKLADFDHFVKDVLEPLCRPWSSGRPAASTHPIRPRTPANESAKAIPTRSFTLSESLASRSRSMHALVQPSYGPFLLTA